MHELKIDHVTIAGPDLKELERCFSGIGMETEFGGAHSNGITHMSLLGFDDGSYIELISTIEGAKQSPWWHEHIAGAAGPCGWAIQVGDVGREAKRIGEFGVDVRGPIHMQRKRPDGKLVEWDLAFLGEGQPGTSLPFLICDRTPRELRVRPSPSVSGGPLTGIDTVIIGVRDLEKAVTLWRRVFDFGEPLFESCKNPPGRVAEFPSTPLALASPATSAGWLADRLDQFGECPCAYLIGTNDLEAATTALPVQQSTEWFRRRVAWLAPSALNGMHLGVIERRDAP